ncbi:VID27 cytoplasmic protein [Colletotrichum costaricense]|uniref:VID27 cytoplasmic protein n=1 Tax=Colletotrichum costaricense TaxID=1209916 RepID=A0AAJ0DSN8_9PEZI|nr:VID27 cytoplasmic protein [Colletotrichum costaricense]KAK1506571.1 VID27 cytoplasmic protein [Colletotrichum costaricense]
MSRATVRLAQRHFQHQYLFDTSLGAEYATQNIRVTTLRLPRDSREAIALTQIRLSLPQAKKILAKQAKAKRSSYGIVDAESSKDNDDFDNDYASLSLVTLNIRFPVTTQEPQLIQQPIEGATLYPWVAVELNPSDGHVENPFLASMNPEQMHRLHRRIRLWEEEVLRQSLRFLSGSKKFRSLPRQLESVGEGHPDKIADQVFNAFPRLLLRRRYFGGYVMSPGQVAQFERVAKECQYERKYRKPHTTSSGVDLKWFEFRDERTTRPQKDMIMNAMHFNGMERTDADMSCEKVGSDTWVALHDGASLKLAREQPIPPASPIRDLMFKVACETATKAAQTVMVAGSSQDTEDLKELDCISWSSCGTCARIAKECQYERKYRKPHTNVSEVDLKQFEFQDEQPISPATVFFLLVRTSAGEPFGRHEGSMKVVSIVSYGSGRRRKWTGPTIPTFGVASVGHQRGTLPYNEKYARNRKQETNSYKLPTRPILFSSLIFFKAL